MGSPRDAGPWHPTDARGAVRRTRVRAPLWPCCRLGARPFPPGGAWSCPPGQVAESSNLGLGRQREHPALINPLLKPLLILGLLGRRYHPPRPLTEEVDLCLSPPWSHHTIRAPGTSLMRGGPSTAGALQPAVPERRSSGAVAKGLEPSCACISCVDARGAVRESSIYVVTLRRRFLSDVFT
jgi:hypothetical protein